MFDKFQYFILAFFVLCAGCYKLNTPQRADELMRQGWAGPTPQARKKINSQIFCYKTLSGTDCYNHPIEEWAHLRVGGEENHCDQHMQIK